jgi:hypothetical protein
MSHFAAELYENYFTNIAYCIVAALTFPKVREMPSKLLAMQRVAL